MSCWSLGSFFTNELCSPDHRDLLNSGNTNRSFNSWRDVKDSTDTVRSYVSEKNILCEIELILRSFWNLCSWRSSVVSYYFSVYSLSSFETNAQVTFTIICFFITDWNVLTLVNLQQICREYRVWVHCWFLWVFFFTWVRRFCRITENPKASAAAHC